MGKSKVYFTNFRTRPDQNILQKLDKLMKKAEMEKIVFDKKFTAVKMHFGEPGNLAFIRPNYVRRITDYLKSLGGLVFLTDTNTIYRGKRSHAVDHLQTAAENGFNPISVGCNVIIADGIKGTDQREVEIDCKHVKTAKIGTAIADADIIVTVNHFKGHEMTGFGGAVKNLGMGCGSRCGKLEMHSSSKPVMIEEKCIGCGQCAKSCSQDAVYFNNKKAQIDMVKCIGCGQCVSACLYDAAVIQFNEAADIAAEKIAEYAYAAIKDKPAFHISFIMNISPNCDCWWFNDTAIVPDIGIAASYDPVALDKACVDMVNNAPEIKGSALDDNIQQNCSHSAGEHSDKFKIIYPGIDWFVTLKHAEELKLGSLDYELVQID
ncbi:MAG: DUF362 domain-containing protein [Clostridia bacterium]|nr:DUF362 domain-containing protein [Clostridia bacterium]